MTLSIGTAAARKADLSNAADAAAYSTAVATARSFNTGAILNRTIVSHYVAMAGVEAQMVYASTVHNYFNLAAVMFRLYDDGNSDGIGFVDYADSHFDPQKTTGCTKRTDETRDASYEMWHVALRGMRPPGGSNPPDQVDARCKGPTCTLRRPWLAESEPELEQKAAEQGRAIHGAIWDLAEIERETYRNLVRAVDRGTWAKQIAAAARVGTVLVPGRQLGHDELDDATGTGAVRVPVTFQRPLTEAILGTRRRREPLLLPTVPENLPPMVTQMQAITDAAFAVYPGQPFKVQFGVTETSADFSFQDLTDPMIEDPLVPGEPEKDDANELFPAIEFAHARSVRGRVTTFYTDACTGQVIRYDSGQPPRRNPATGQLVDLSQTGKMEVFVRSAGKDQGGGKHVRYGKDSVDGIHWPLLNGGCHGNHQHYGWTKEDVVHDLPEDTLPKDVLAFVLPDSDPKLDSPQGAHGVWGQPVIPVMLTQKHNAAGDPFNLNVGFKFRSTGAGARFDMRKSVDTALAPAAAIAYYHRRGHLGEPPNLLNPFWHATLVPVEIDERRQNTNGQLYDPTQASQSSQSAGKLRMEMLIDAADPNGGSKDARDAYNGLRKNISGMSLPPAQGGR
jgi:hypothetical protein